MKKTALAVYGAAGFMIIVMLLAALFMQGGDLRFVYSGARELNSGWYTVLPDGSRTPVTLPAELDGAAGRDMVAVTVLPDTVKTGDALCIRSSLQTLRVLLNGSEIYSRSFESGSIFKNPVVSVWSIVDLPPDSAGGELTLVLNSPYKAFSGTLNPVVYGSRDALYGYLIHHYGPGFLVAVMIFIIGLLMLLMPLFIRKIHERGLIHLGLFSMLAALWLMGESRMLQFFIGSPLLIAAVSYLTLALFPIPLLLYIAEMLQIRSKKIYRFLCGLLVADFTVCFCLQIFGVLDFFESVIMTHAVILLCGVVVVGTLIREILDKNPAAVRFSFAAFILIGFGIVEIVNFHLGSFDATSMYMRIGLLLFILVLGAFSVMQLCRAVERGNEAQFYARMAYRDILTGGNNRTAYDRDVSLYTKYPDRLRGLRLVMLDLNDLKVINDCYGHAAGDQAIRDSYACMQTAFGRYGTCYRIGGDEFACLLPGCSHEDYEKAKHVFNTAVCDIDLKTEYAFSVAVGSAVFNPAVDGGIQSFLTRADQSMYHTKRVMKYGPPAAKAD